MPELPVSVDPSTLPRSTDRQYDVKSRHFGSELRTLRRQLGLTQQELAEDLDIDPTHPQRLESRPTPPNKWDNRYRPIIVKKWPHLAHLVPSEADWPNLKQPKPKQHLLATQVQILQWHPAWSDETARAAALGHIQQVAGWIGWPEKDILANPYRFAVAAAGWLSGETDRQRREKIYHASVEAEFYGRCRAIRLLYQCFDRSRLRPVILAAIDQAQSGLFLEFQEMLALLDGLWPISVHEELAVCFVCRDVFGKVIQEFGDWAANEAIRTNDQEQSREILLIATSESRIHRLRRALTKHLAQPGVDPHYALSKALRVLTERPPGWPTLSVQGVQGLPFFLDCAHSTTA